MAEALELAEESGNITALGWALVSQARIDALRGRLDEAAAGLDRAEELFSQSGNAWALARLNNHYGWVERRRGDLPAADRRFRDAIRILKPLEDRGTLCESQRGLAQVLVVLKKIDEAERTRSRRARPSARTTRSRARRRGWRSGSFAPRRAVTRRPRRCCGKAWRRRRQGPAADPPRARVLD